MQELVSSLQKTEQNGAITMATLIVICSDSSSCNKTLKHYCYFKFITPAYIMNAVAGAV